MSFNIGLSGLAAANKQLDVTGNNIANVSTTGFKSSRVDFSSVYASSKLGSGSNTSGSGVTVSAVSQNFNQGDVNSTGNVLDMGIQGNGFFVMNDNGSLTYTRSGAFKTDNAGFITNSDGTARLQGYGVDGSGRVVKGVLTDLQVNTSNLAPKATALVSSAINLNSTATVLPTTSATFNPTDPGTYSTSFSTPIFDSQGNQHTMNQYMVKTGATTWDTYTLVDGFNPDGTTPSAVDPAQPVTITFNAAGQLSAIAVPPPPFSVLGNKITLNAWTPGKVVGGAWQANGASASATGITMDMSSTTQYNADSARSLPTQDGYSAGQLTSLSIDGSGTLYAKFSNSQSKAIGEISLASFTNEQGLQAASGTGWRQTADSGIPAYDSPQTGTLGSIVSGSLESSNVNLSGELVGLIQAQSNYQANAKTISTQSTLMQALIQMA